MMHSDSVFHAARRFESSGTPYALVSVIRAIAPTSAQPGDKAVVTADGTLHGWIGGGCAQPVVIRAVRQVLADGQARLIRIAPTAETAERELGDVLEFGMSCHSGGTLEMFIDPVLPRPCLVVIGTSPVARGLARIAPCVGFAVTVVAPGAEPDVFVGADQVLADDAIDAVRPHVPAGAWIVIATQGRRDIQGLRLALALEARQVSFVASAKKAQVLKASLVAAGSDAGAVEAIVAPAGYPMAATTPEEIALSVLAAIVSARRGMAVQELPSTTAPVSVSAPMPAHEMSAGPEPEGSPASATTPMPLDSGGRGNVGQTAPTRSCCGTSAAVFDSPGMADATVSAPAKASSCCGG